MRLLGQAGCTVVFTAGAALQRGFPPCSHARLLAAVQRGRTTWTWAWRCHQRAQGRRRSTARESGQVLQAVGQRRCLRRAHLLAPSASAGPQAVAATVPLAWHKAARAHAGATGALRDGDVAARSCALTFACRAEVLPHVKCWGVQPSGVLPQHAAKQTPRPQRMRMRSAGRSVDVMWGWGVQQHTATHSACASAAHAVK